MLFSKFLFCILILFTQAFSAVKSQGFPCKTPAKCQSQVGYLPGNVTTLSKIATLFGVKDFNSLLGANNLPLDTPPSQSAAVNVTVKIPFTCSCNNGTGISDKSPIYKVKTGDFLDHIARDIFSLLFTYQEIAAVNKIRNPEHIDDGQVLRIPLPCSCDKLDGNQVFHYAHVVVRHNGDGDVETLDMIARELGVTVESILKLNGGKEEPDPETVLDVPLRACKSTVSNNTSPDFPLLVPNGTYALTANNCIRCKCDYNNKNSTLHCEPSPPEVKVQNWQQCPSVRCIGSGAEANASSYALGQISYIAGCDETRCAYTGYNNRSRTISASLVNGSICPDVTLLALKPPPSSTNATTPNSKGKNSFTLAISIGIPSVIAVLSAIAVWLFCFNVDDEIRSAESLQFDFITLRDATDNFSEANKLGEGGFGAVYKGTLEDRQEIAVKRLSENSCRIEQEFRNEVILVAKLQHRNLVRLLGFCLAGEEKLLIYEFMPNASLDQFIFDPIKSTYLDWERRYKIIEGIAKGLLYLHEESRLKIIHRDLKASNILLDTDMNPKIADFGTARLFVVDQTHASTNRIVGTHGYMAPEYILHGQFSAKSDVYSFGVLILEILSGQKNSRFQNSEMARDLLSYAWRHWKKNSALDLLDPVVKDTCSGNDAMRCILIGLLCVQENVADRPTMRRVFLMLNSDSVTHGVPSPPPFYTGHTEEQGTMKGMSTTEYAALSVNETSMSELEPR
ncbi:hypothetical protein C5167_011038 [Papaver somniferum]|uniref:Protein kinase domain-containing protein n=1 Tax=Papaver somniferum TaxID=3469 RepID=A0A4Y7K4S8_PAPSO|nr:hypothetical protein C5167_011038 [Papaver somniferum]